MAALKNSDRDAIVRKVIGRRYDEEEATLRANRNRLGGEVYDALMPPAVRAAVVALPAGFLYESDNMTVVEKGKRMVVQFGESRRIPNEDLRLPAKCTEWIAYQLVQGHLDALRAQREAARRETRQQLDGFNTFAQLRAGWPEIEAFIPPEPPKAKALVRVNASINKLLQLPP